MRQILSTVALLFLTCSPSFAEPLEKSDPLYQEMLALDGKIFETGFNRCELDVYDEILAEDLEFYHDVAGPLFGKTKFIDNMRTGVCQSEYKLRRVLITDSMEVFPLRHDGELYGALVNGEHLFFETPPDGAEGKAGRAKFSIFWVKQNEHWLLKRTFSYDHGPAGAN